MKTVRERLDDLKKAKGIPGDSELLRQMHPYLLREGKTKYTKVEEFVKKIKGSFSQMVDGKNGRVFDQNFYLPLEIVLETSMAYLLEGRGGKMPDNQMKGIRFAAYTDTKGNYEKVIEEDVYLDQDEYHKTLLDYILEFNSKNGLGFFADRDELPLNEIVCLDRGKPFGMNHHTIDDLVEALLRLCPLEKIGKYFNGFFFVENAIEPRYCSQADIEDIQARMGYLLNREDIREALATFKRIPLSKANPSLYSQDGRPLGETGFINILFYMMLNYALSDAANIDDEIRVELLDKAYALNEEVIPMILGLSYDSYRILDYGYVYSEFVVCGSIATLDSKLHMVKTYSSAVLEKMERLNAQVQSFYERIAASNQVNVFGREMKLKKQDNQDFYDFYQTMGKEGCDLVAQFEEGKSENRDCFLLPEGERVHLPAPDRPGLFPKALKALAVIDAISESALGEGKAYHFPNINNRFFFAVGETITGIAPIEVVIGERYDNLAEFLLWTCLFTPYFQAASNQVFAFAIALKEYGVKKNEVSAVLEAFKSYFKRSLLKYDKSTERGKLLIANGRARIVWCELYADEIIEQFK